MGDYGSSSIFDSFTLSPLPYPVLFILAVTFIFPFISTYFRREDAFEAAEDKMSWILFAIPVALIVLVCWLSSMDYSVMSIFSSSPWDKRRRTHHLPSEGSSPWGVAAMIVLLLLLVKYQSSFLENWF